MTYFNQERFEDLLTWLQLPALTADAPYSAKELKLLETSIESAREAARTAGYNLKLFCDIRKQETGWTPVNPN